MKLGTHMPDGERRKPIDIEVCRTKVKVTTSKNRTKIRYFFVSAQYLKYKKLSTLMLRGTSLMNLRFVGQRSRSQFLKIEQ